jgi:DNA-binding GntR family transcriptional regulator
MKASDTAYEALLNEIVDGTLEAGTILAEVEQSSRLGVSRTPLREALSRLRKDGLIAAQSGRGLAVTEISVEDIQELYELRQPLEQQAARLAALRGNPALFATLAEEFRNAEALIEGGQIGIRAYYDLNERLDRAIEEAISNRYLITALKALHLHLARIRRLNRGNIQRLKQAAVETLVIIEAIVDGDADLAASATQVHLRQSQKATLEAARKRAAKEQQEGK